MDSDDSSSSSSKMCTPRLERASSRNQSFRNLISDDTTLSNFNVSLNPKLSITHSTKIRAYDEDDEEETYQTFLNCVLSPLKSQARELETHVSLGNQKVSVSFENDHTSRYSSQQLTGEESFQMQIIKTLNRIFPRVRNKEFIWKKLVSCKDFDPTIAVLHHRQLTIAKNEYYTRKNFVSDDSFVKWKAYEMTTSENLMVIAMKERSTHFYYSLEFKLKQLTGISTALSYELEVDSFKWKGKSKSLHNGLLTFDQFPPLIERKSEQIKSFPTLKVTLIKEKLLGSENIGSFTINLGDFAKSYEPSGSWWGVQCKTDEKVEIQLANGGYLLAEYDICLRFQIYPNHTIDILPEETNLIPHEMLELFMEKLIYSTDMATELLNYHEKWLISEFCCIYGISDLFKHLMILRGLTGRIDLLIPFYHELSSSLLFIDTMMEDDYPPSTIRERNLFDNLLKEVRNRLHSVLQNFLYYFPSNEPPNALPTLVELLREIESRFYKVKESDYIEREQQFIIQSTKKAYETMKEEHVEMIDAKDELDGTSYSQFVKLLRDSLSEFQCYSLAFHESIPVDTLIIEEISKSLLQDVDSLLKRKKNDPYGILHLVLELQKLEKDVQEDYGDNMPDVTFPNYKVIIDQYLPLFLDKMGQTLTEWMLNAVSLDNWIPISSTDMYSSSLVDFFTSAEKIKSFFLELDFVSAKSFDHILKIICNAALGYGNALHRLAAEDLQNRKLLTPPEGYILKINDLQASKERLHKLCESILNHKSEIFPDDVDNTLESRIYVTKAQQDLDDIIDEGISVYVSFILPEVEKCLSKVIQEGRTVKKIVVDDQSIPETLKRCTQTYLKGLYKEFFDDMFSISKDCFLELNFTKFLTQLYTCIILKIQGIILKGETTLLKDQKKKQLRPLNHMQILLLKYTLNLLEVYFEGSGEGLPRKVLQASGKGVNSLMAMYILQDSQTLIKAFGALYDNPKISERVGVHITAYYIYLVLRTRGDADARAFIKAKKNMVPLIHLKSEFTLLKDEILVDTIEVRDSNDILCTLFITNKRLLLDKSLLMTKAGWVEISLNNIIRLTLIRHVSGKGYKIEYYDKGGLFKEKLKRIRLYTVKSGTRKHMFSTMKSVIRAAGNTSVDDMSKIETLGIDYDEFIKSDIDSSLETEHGEDGKSTSQKPESIKYYQTLRRQVRKALQDEMRHILHGVAKEERIIDRFKCKFHGKSGNLYVLSFHYFFAQSRDRDPQRIKNSLVHLSSIVSIRKSGSKSIEISLRKNGEEKLELYTSFLERDEAIECINTSMLNLATTTRRLEKLKEKQVKEIEKHYMALKGKFNGEKGKLYLTETQVIWKSNTPGSKLQTWNVRDLIKAKTIFRSLRKGKIVKMKFLNTSAMASEQPIRIKVSVKSSSDASEWIRLVSQRKHLLSVQDSKMNG